MKSPVVSICIPTYGRTEIFEKTLKSILSQDADPSSYEVCVADNSPTDETKGLLESRFSGYANLRYEKNASSGYLNSIEALAMGRGRFLKLHNNYSCFAPGMLRPFIKSVGSSCAAEPLLFYTSGALKGSERLVFGDFDSFMRRLSYWSTWSTSFGIWKSDFDRIRSDGRFLPDPMFPHTSYLFACGTKTEYVIDDGSYLVNQELSKKGGYNLAKTFCVGYLGMVKALLSAGRISDRTYRRIRRGLLFGFMLPWYCNVVCEGKRYTFYLTDTRKHLSVHYPLPSILLFYAGLTFALPLRLLSYILKRKKDS